MLTLLCSAAISAVRHSTLSACDIDLKALFALLMVRSASIFCVNTEHFSATRLCRRIASGWHAASWRCRNEHAAFKHRHDDNVYAP